MDISQTDIIIMIEVIAAGVILNIWTRRSR